MCKLYVEIVETATDVNSLNLFNYAQQHKFAIPAINVTSSSTVVAALEAARDKKSPIILQTSQGGAAYFAGKVCDARDAREQSWLTNDIGCRQQEPGSLDCWRSRCSSLHPICCSPLRDPSHSTHGSLREEAATMVGWHAGCR